jgi:uncharacterized protein GlcG (DUF336 family)
MRQQTTLDLEDAQRAMVAAFAEASKDRRPMAVAVADVHGDLLLGARMDGAHARVLRHAIRKAYTAAVMQRNTLTFKQDLKERDGNLDEWGDSRLTTLQGGKVVVVDGRVVGAVAVGGNSLQRDEEIADVAVKAMMEHTA